MKLKSLEVQLRSIIKNLNLISQSDSIKLDDNLFTKGALDSLILVQYILELEEHFKINIPNTDINYENFKTLARQIQYLESQLKSSIQKGS